MASASAIKVDFSTTQMNADIESIWTSLSISLQSILRSELSHLSFADLHCKGYNITIRGHGNYLYHNVKELFYMHSKNTIIPQIRAATTSQFLSVLKETYTLYTTRTSIVADVLMYLDKSLQCSQNSLIGVPTVKPPTIYRASINCYRDSLFNGEACTMCTKALMDSVSKARSTGSPLMPLFFDVLQILRQFGDQNTDVYQECFVNPFLSTTQSYYQKIRELALSKESTVAYFHTVQNLYNFEKTLVNTFSCPKTATVAISLFIEEFLTQNCPTFFDFASDGILELCNTQNYDELFNIYYFLDDINCCQELFHSYLCRRIDLLRHFPTSKHLLEQNESQNCTFVHFSQQLSIPVIKMAIEWHEEYRQIAGFVKRGKRTFSVMSLLDASFMKLLDSVSYFYFNLSAFFNHIIAATNVNDSEFEAKFSSGLGLLSFVTSLDTFEGIYRKIMIERYISAHPLNIDREQYALSKFTTCCGTKFTSKTSTALADVIHSLDLDKKIECKSGDGVTTFVNVLTGNVWNLSFKDSLSKELVIPAVLRNSFVEFEKHYQSMYKERLLKLVPDLCTLELDIHFTNGRSIGIMCSLLQGMVLTCFNDTNEHTLQSLAACLPQVPNLCLEDILLSLSNSGLMLGSEVFELNDSFCIESSEGCVKIASNTIGIISAKMIQQEFMANNSRTCAMSEYEKLQAAIMLILKYDREVKHGVLFSKLCAVCRFKVTASNMKEGIDFLMSRNYIQRDVNDSEKYFYVI